MLNKLSILILVFGILEFGYRRILTYLRFFQQEEYSTRRFTAWIRERRAIDTRGTAILASVGLLSIFFPSPWLTLLFSLLGSGALFLTVRYLEEDPRRSGKIRLTMTQRASKISIVAFVCYAVAALVPIFIFCPSCCSAPEQAVAYTALWGLVLAHTPALCLLLANKILWPAERALQERYYRDAQRILREVNPFVIGITGSYGKTGAKAALGDLLTQCLGPTFWPRKSINTVMGITRTIRETMKPYHSFAVIEMGAYQQGSIKRLCEFTPPRAALVTAVGIMHLERFGSPENVYRAKSEIAQALPPDGILVCNGDSPNARRMASEHRRARTLLYGLDHNAGPLDCYASNLSFDERGTSFTIHWLGEAYRGRTPLLGRPALSNALGAFTLACALGASPSYAAACLSNLEPVDNRLVYDRKPGTSFLRDAYNSNPTGFAAALEVLKHLPAQRRIVMTPGMIELGEQQATENRRIASMCAGIADMVIVVGRVNRESLLAGLSDAGYSSEKIVTVNTRDEAFEALRDREQSGDLVLIENDLGDLHEGTIRL